MDREELLYRYFSNNLDAQETEQFNMLLKTDEAFKEKFNFEKKIQRLVKEEKHTNLKEKLNRFEEELEVSKTAPKPKFFYLKIAASILLLVSVGWYAYQNFSAVDYSNLYAENIDVYPNTVYPITRSDTINSFEREAFVAFETKNYSLAVKKFEAAQPSKTYFSFYKAQCYLNLNALIRAKQFFKDVVNDGKGFVKESKWYLALIAIKEQDKKTAIRYLKEVVENGGYKQNESQELLKALK